MSSAAHFTQQSIDGCRTHQEQLGADLRLQLQVSVMLECWEQRCEDALQSFSAGAIGRFPQDDQCLL
jgi:hypothetical protein